jgi:hypothetical protein
MGHVMCMGEMRNGYKILVGKPERDHKEELERIILKLILEN